MRSTIALAAFLLLSSIGCSAEREQTETANTSAAEVDVVQTSPETFALGTEIGPTGAVPQQAAGESFVRGGEVYLSVNVSGASTDQTIEVKWVDPEGRVLRHDMRRAPQGTEHVPFSSGATAGWPRGEHRAVVVIDGRRVSEKEFAVL